MPDVSVIVGTYGDMAHWGALADEALESVAAQTVKARDAQHVHARNLSEARNQGARAAAGEWLCFLDADDALGERYIEAMLTKAETLDEGNWLLQPATVGVVDGECDNNPTLIPARRLSEGNFLIVATLVRREQFLAVGGFRELAAFEDWDLWIRCALDGARVAQVPDAVYRVTVRSDSRNDPAHALDHSNAYNTIRRSYVGEWDRLTVGTAEP